MVPAARARQRIVATMASKRTASPSVLSATGFELIKQYPGEEQVRLKVVVEIPGSWFGSGVAGSLTANERAEKYRAQAVEFAAVHEFKKAGAKKASKEPGIRFICIADAAEDANHPGFWINLAQWNRYRHETYKNRRDDELQSAARVVHSHGASQVLRRRQCSDGARHIRQPCHR